MEAGSWNHRLEACYRSFADAPSNENVKAVFSRGLLGVKMIHHRIPPKVWKRLIETHNTFHVGAGINYIDVISESVQVECEWEHSCSKSGLHSSNPKYKAYYRDFVLTHSPCLGFCKRVTCDVTVT